MGRKPLDKNKKDESYVLTTEKVEEILEREKLGLQKKRTERLWKDNIQGVRHEGIKFGITEKELEEYIKCKKSVYYFAENYCQIKREDGTIGFTKLRDYQKDIIKLYTENRYSLLCAARQSGKCSLFNTNVLIVNNNKEPYKTNLGTIYYNEIKKERNLTYLEKIKIFLYKILQILD